MHRITREGIRGRQQCRVGLHTTASRTYRHSAQRARMQTRRRTLRHHSAPCTLLASRLKVKVEEARSSVRSTSRSSRSPRSRI